MAEPPNKLTALIFNQSPDEMYQTLLNAKCLSPAARAQREKVIAAIEEGLAIARRNDEQRLVGPTGEYIVVGRLAHYGFLNARAERLLDSVLVRQHWWQFWRR